MMGHERVSNLVRPTGPWRPGGLRLQEGRSYGLEMVELARWPGDVVGRRTTDGFFQQTNVFGIPRRIWHMGFVFWNRDRENLGLQRLFGMD